MENDNIAFIHYANDIIERSRASLPVALDPRVFRANTLLELRRLVVLSIFSKISTTTQAATYMLEKVKNIERMGGQPEKALPPRSRNIFTELWRNLEAIFQ